MYLTHLSLTDFRIFSRFDQDVPQNALILIGDNAQGKTSLLEAIYYLSSLDSFQASNSVELINFSALQNDLAICRMLITRRVIQIITWKSGLSVIHTPMETPLYEKKYYWMGKRKKSTLSSVTLMQFCSFPICFKS